MAYSRSFMVFIDHIKTNRTEWPEISIVWTHDRGLRS